MSTPSNNLLELSPRLIFDLASQMNPPEVVAQDHGLDPQWLSEFVELPHVRRAIKDKKAELDAAGYSLVQKSRLMFEDGLADVYRKMKDPGVSLSALVETMKFLRSTAQLDKPEQTVASEKFVININLGGVAQQPITVDIQAVEVADLGSPPAYILGSDNHYTDLEYREYAD